LTRRVDICGLANLTWEFGNGFSTGIAYLIDAESNDGSHGANAHGNCLLHILAAKAHGANRISKTYGAGDHMGRVFT
jgi:hypothetical protein